MCAEFGAHFQPSYTSLSNRTRFNIVGSHQNLPGRLTIMTDKTNESLDKSNIGISRRDLLKTASAMGVLSAIGSSTAWSSVRKKDKLTINMAGYDYDRVQALIDGRVEIEFCTTKFEVSRIGDLNTHIFSGPKTREVTEIGLHPFMIAYANEGFRDYTLLPIFPLRVFRHKSIYIRTDRGIKKPEDFTRFIL